MVLPVRDLLFVIFTTDIGFARYIVVITGQVIKRIVLEYRLV